MGFFDGKKVLITGATGLIGLSDSKFSLLLHNVYQPLSNINEFVDILFNTVSPISHDFTVSESSMT